MKLIVNILTLFTVSFGVAQATPSSKQVATITQIQGKAQIFVNPTKKAPQEKNTKDGTMAFFEGEYYLIQEAKQGDQVKKDTIIRTLPNARVNVVYENGDQFNMGPGTAYRVTWNDKTDVDAKIKLMYGRLRGVVAKDGPRQKFEIKTRGVTMGVRGTDFFIADTGVNGETEISVLRGSVAVTTGKKEQEVKTGQSATITAPPVPTATADNKKDGKKAEVVEAKIEFRETTKEDLSGIQKASTVTTPVVPQVADTKLTAKIVELEKKALVITTKDIQLYQPELYKKIAAEGVVTNAQDLNTKMITLVATSAPSAPPKRTKPRITEMKDAEEGDVYDKYFKINQ
jgi:hypothetical protein